MKRLDIEPKATAAEAERVLIEAAQHDPRRFAALFELHFDRVYAFVHRRVRNHDTAEDLTSEVFHSALRNIKQYEYRGIPFSAWLFRIALNAIAQRGRQTARERGLPANVTEPFLDDDAERAALLFQLVQKLPAEQQRVIELRYCEQRSMQEIAGLMERTEAAAKQLHYRTLENLRKYVEGAP